MKHILSPILLSLSLIACGGGGGDVSTSTPIPATLYETSYKNFKLNGSDLIKYPNYQLRWKWGDPTVGFGDFLKAGELSVFVAYQNYNPDITFSQVQNNPNEYASEFVFYTVNPDRSLTKAITMKGCLSPRKATVADFNKDGIPDVLVVCSGYDGVPFLGEKSKLLLSNGRGNYTSSDVLDIEFNHGAAAADINGDGYPDIVRAAGGTLAVFINQKNGTFDKHPNLINDNDNKGYYNVELVDFNDDGLVDIIAGGHEWGQNGLTPTSTKIWYGDGNVSFGSVTKTIPAVPGKGVVNDFTFIVNGNQKIIYVDRTSDPSDPLGWYRGIAVQKYDLTSDKSTLVAEEPNATWVPWLLPKFKNNQSGVGAFNSNSFYQ